MELFNAIRLLSFLYQTYAKCICIHEHIYKQKSKVSLTTKYTNLHCLQHFYHSGSHKLWTWLPEKSLIWDAGFRYRPQYRVSDTIPIRTGRILLFYIKSFDKVQKLIVCHRTDLYGFIYIQHAAVSFQDLSIFTIESNLHHSEKSTNRKCCYVFICIGQLQEIYWYRDMSIYYRERNAGISGDTNMHLLVMWLLTKTRV